MDIWSADSGGGGTGPTGLHLHHPGGLPRDVRLPHLSDILQASQGSLCEVVEGQGQEIDPTQEVFWRSYILKNSECIIECIILAILLLVYLFPCWFVSVTVSQ